MAIERENLWDDVVKPLIIEQYKYASNWKKCLKAVIDSLQTSEDNLFALQDYFVIPQSVDDVSSVHLDFLAGLISLKRYEDESDETFFARFISFTQSKEAGTPNEVIRQMSVLTGDSAPIFHEETTATFFVHTPNATKRVSNAEVNRLAPVGVLGVNSAALVFADGSRIGLHPSGSSYSSKLICVAKDSTIGT